MAGLTDNTPPTVDDSIIHSSTVAPPDSSSKVAPAESPQPIEVLQVVGRSLRGVSPSIVARMKEFQRSRQSGPISEPGKLPVSSQDATSIARMSESLSSSGKPLLRRGIVDGKELSLRNSLRRTISSDLLNENRKKPEGVEGLVDSKTSNDLGDKNQV